MGGRAARVHRGERGDRLRGRGLPGRREDDRREQRQHPRVPEVAGYVPERGRQDRLEGAVQEQGGHVLEGGLLVDRRDIRFLLRVALHAKLAMVSRTRRSSVAPAATERNEALR